MGLITIKSAWEIEAMKQAGKATAAAREAAGAAVAPGVKTAELDEIVRETLKTFDATPSFLNYNGYPASVCVSINDEVIHGIPGKRRIKEGDIVSVDVGAILEGFQGDSAATYGAGQISPEAQALIDATRQSFFEGVKFARKGNRVSDISHAVQVSAEAAGYSLVRTYTGHGIGREMHEDPEVPNFGEPGRGARLFPGMTIAIEPMVNAGDWRVRVLADRWTVVTSDGSLSAHYEHTVLITEGDPVLLTL